MPISRLEIYATMEAKPRAGLYHMSSTGDAVDGIGISKTACGNEIEYMTDRKAFSKLLAAYEQGKLDWTTYTGRVPEAFALRYHAPLCPRKIGGPSTAASPGDAQICATEGAQNVSNEERGDSSLAVSDLAGSIR